MTILIDTMRNAATAAAVKAGGVCEVCSDHPFYQIVVTCPKCKGKGTRYHYVGRAMPRRGAKANALGNPFVVGKDGDATKCLESYEYRIRCALQGTALVSPARIPSKPCSFSDVQAKIDPIADAISAILTDLQAGRTVVLVCWCAKCQREPYPDPENHADGCHADVVAKLVKEAV